MIAIAVSLGALMEIVDTSIVNVAINDMQAQMSASVSAIGWVITSYAVANVVILPLSAWLGDGFGRKCYFVFGLVAFTSASVMCGLANSLTTLIVARVLQGVFGGGLLAKAQSILFETFPREEQAKTQGLFGAVVIAGPAIGPVLGGWLVTNYNWRWIFFINLPIGILAVVLCIRCLPKDAPYRGFHGHIDWLAIASLTVGLGSLQTVLEEGQTEDWFASNYIRYFSVAAVLGVSVFLRRSLTANDPLVDLRVLRYRSLWSGCILSFLLGAALYGANLSVPLFAQNIMRLTSEQTGFMLAPSAIAFAAGMALAIIMMRWIDVRRVVVIGVGLCAITSYSMVGLSTGTTRDFFFWPLLLRGLGITMIFLPINLAALGSIPKEDTPQASGLFSLTRQLGGSIGIAILTTMLDQRNSLHRSALVSHLTEVDINVVNHLRHLADGFMQNGTDSYTAMKAAYAALDGQVQLQTSILSFSDLMLLSSLVFVVMVPFIGLLEKPREGAEVSMGH